MKKLQLPLSAEDVRELSAGESLLLSGTVFTARDAAHKYLAGSPDMSKLPDLRGSVLYHCGPVIVKDGGEWRVTAAGPTTSIREEPYMPAIIEKYGIRGIIGKGGMGEATLKACRDFACAYLHAVGGTAQVLASAVKKVSGVYMYEEFGAPEALWQLEVVDFPVIVTMDSRGVSLHCDVLAASARRLQELLKK